MEVDEPPPPDPPPTPKAPAGWYPDPDGNPGQRYFDGFHWTDQSYDANAKFSLALTKNDLATTAVYTVVAIVAVIAFVFVSHGFTHKTDNTSSRSNSATQAAPSTPTTPTFSEQQIEAGVIRACEKHIKAHLKDPDSARFDDDWKAWIVTTYNKPPEVSYHPENGDKLYSAGGAVNAKNSFGGYVGFTPYGCEASVTVGGYIEAHAYSLDDLVNPNGTP